MALNEQARTRRPAGESRAFQSAVEPAQTTVALMVWTRTSGLVVAVRLLHAPGDREPAAAGTTLPRWNETNTAARVSPSARIPTEMRECLLGLRKPATSKRRAIGSSG